MKLLIPWLNPVMPKKRSKYYDSVKVFLKNCERQHNLYPHPDVNKRTPKQKMEYMRLGILEEQIFEEKCENANIILGEESQSKSVSPYKNCNV